MQTTTYKSVYFRDHPASDPRGKALTIAIGPREPGLADAVRGMSSHQIRAAIGHSSYSSLQSAATSADLPVHTFCVRALRSWFTRTADSGPQLPGLDSRSSHLVTFKDDKRIPFQRWFPLLEGYSLAFVDLLLSECTTKPTCVLDPFSGIGTTPLAVALRGSTAYYAELNPVFQKVAAAKFIAIGLNQDQRAAVSEELRSLADDLPAALDSVGPDRHLHQAYLRTFGTSNYFSDHTLETVLSVRTYLDTLNTKASATREFVQIATLASLQPASLLVRAGDLRFRTERDTAQMQPLIPGIQHRMLSMADDIQHCETITERPLLVSSDAKRLDRLPPLGIDAIVTSPPYLNGTNYIRNTKLELWFIRALADKSQLRSYRNASVTAGINDVIGPEPPVRSKIAQTAIDMLRTRAYDSRIPKLVASYANDIERVFGGLAMHMREGAPAFIDIGDSSYAGVHVATDEILTEVAAKSGFQRVASEVLRTRMSRSGIALSQKLITLEYAPKNQGNRPKTPGPSIERLSRWAEFKETLPHQSQPFSKRNWGNARHSMCSYQGKMKPSLAYKLVETFACDGGSVLDPFSGVGTIPFEACLSGRRGLGFEISPAAWSIMASKLMPPDEESVEAVLYELQTYIDSAVVEERDRISSDRIAFNGPLSAYFHDRTLDEVLLARSFFRRADSHPATEFVRSCLLHILHGNRPYALSRRSHSITPFAPTGPTEYRALMPRLRSKVRRMLDASLPLAFVRGEALLQDATSVWPESVADLDAIITSPPFYDSTRFYLANWMRLWFCGWDEAEFESQPRRFVEERQKDSFDVYQPLLRQARERLTVDGVLVLHLGKSHKSDMANELERVAKPWFRVVDRFDESVGHTESHGFRDKGAVTSHQYLVLA